MSYQERVEKIIDSLDLGKPIFNVSLRGKYLELEESNWDPGLEDKGFIENLVNRYARRTFSSSKRAYIVDKEDAIKNIGDHAMSNVLDVFVKCSPYSEPRRTNIYKGFCNVVNDNRNNIEFKKSIFDIYEYYHNSTLTESIKHPNNDVHRKNIYQLFFLMEKSYGKKTSN